MEKQQGTTAKVSWPTLLVIVLGAILLTTLATYQTTVFILTPPTGDHKDPQIKTNVHVYVQDAFGTRDVLVGNTITNFGENLTRQPFWNGTGPSDLDCVAIGNFSGTIATSTALSQEGAREDAGSHAGANMTDWMNNGDPAFNVTYQWIEPAFSCNATALHTLSTGNNAYAIATFSQQSGTYNITITWSITYDGND